MARNGLGKYTYLTYHLLVQLFHPEINKQTNQLTKVKAQGLFTASRKFGRHFAAFLVALNALEPIKPLVTKLQKRNQDIFQGYHMIDDVIYRLKEMREDIDSEFHDWYEQAQKIADSVGVEPSTPRISKCRSRYRDN